VLIDKNEGKSYSHNFLIILIYLHSVYRLTDIINIYGFQSLE